MVLLITRLSQIMRKANPAARGGFERWKYTYRHSKQKAYHRTRLSRRHRPVSANPSIPQPVFPPRLKTVLSSTSPPLSLCLFFFTSAVAMPSLIANQARSPIGTASARLPRAPLSLCREARQAGMTALASESVSVHICVCPLVRC